MKDETESRCWLCKEYEETIDHLTSDVPFWQRTNTLQDMIKVCTHLHYSICKTLGIETI
jgi:hypothetical protein